jgi:sorbose reductase
VTKQADVEAVIAQIVRDYNGRLDVFVANSGIAWDEVGVIDSSIAHYHQVMSTNLDGVYYCARAAGWHFRRQAEEKTTITGETLNDFRSGSFVATASMSGHIVNVPHLQAAYNTSKAGVIHLCEQQSFFFFLITKASNSLLGKSLAVEWAGFARANTVSPGFIDSGLTGECSDEVKDSLSGKTPMRFVQTERIMSELHY